MQVNIERDERVKHHVITYSISLSFSRSQTRFKSMEIRGSSFTAFIDVLTNNTYAMIVMSDPNIRKSSFLCVIL